MRLLLFDLLGFLLLLSLLSSLYLRLRITQRIEFPQRRKVLQWKDLRSLNSLLVPQLRDYLLMCFTRNIRLEDVSQISQQGKVRHLIALNKLFPHLLLAFILLAKLSIPSCRDGYRHPVMPGLVLTLRVEQVELFFVSWIFLAHDRVNDF